MPPPPRQKPEPGAARKPVRARRSTDNPELKHDRILLLLAQLLSTLCGVFPGLFVAYFISYLFISPVEKLIQATEKDIRDKQGEIAAYEPELTRADMLYRRLKAQQRSSNQSLPELNAPDAGAQSGPTAPAVASDDLKRAKSEFESADSHMRSLTSRLTLLQQDLADYRQTMLILTSLSFAVVVVMGLIGYLFYPLMRRWLSRSSAEWSALFASRGVRAGPLLIGFFAGLVLAVILLLALFTSLSSSQYIFFGLAPFRLAFGAFITVAFGVTGALVGASYFSPPPPEKDPYEEYRRPAAPNLLDSSVLIDGRIYEVAINGFIQGVLVVPESVLKELQTLADSADERKRLKGRRGLDMVNKLKGDSRLDCMVIDDSAFDAQGRGADDHLLALAKSMGANVVTNDSNLQRVASARDVRVINVNALANAVKTNLVPGEYVEIDITDRGKQRGQGVGFLPDGTMVVVEDGEPFIGMVKTIKLTSISQTQAGRLLFGRVDLAEGRGGNHEGNGHGSNGQQGGGGGR
jgi:uncharacterized protein YacL